MKCDYWFHSNAKCENAVTVHYMWIGVYNSRCIYHRCSQHGYDISQGPQGLTILTEEESICAEILES